MSTTSRQPTEADNNDIFANFREMDYYKFLQENPDYNTAIIGGAGGIGSNIFIHLNKIGVVVHLYDFDTLNKRNSGSQPYPMEDVTAEKPKVEAAHNLSKTLMGTEDLLVPVNDYYKKDWAPIMFAGFDKMKPRRQMFEAWKEACKDDRFSPILVEARLSITDYKLFTLTRDTSEKELEFYDKTALFDDEESYDAPCGIRQTSDVSAACGARMVSIVKNHLANLQNGTGFANVPFYVGWNAETQLDSFDHTEVG